MGVHETFRSILGTYMPPTPRASLGTVGPDEPEITGDHPDLDDDEACAVEGITQPAHEPSPANDNAVAWRVAMVIRLRAAERALKDVNDHLQVHRVALAEIEREARKAKAAHENEIADLKARLDEVEKRYWNLSYRVPA